MRKYENMQHTSENRLPPRAHYIPGGAAQQILLNGSWRFAYFENGDAATEPLSWNTIPVPSCWQMHGYDSPHYSDINFPYPVDPPYVPNINPMGIYEREFSIPKDELNTYLMLEGVCSCGEVYVNGRYVGFTQGSHLQAEFDLTEFVVPGTNTLRVQVRKWCIGSYLEDQDFLRFNGIFRDVYLLRRPKEHLFDFEISTSLTSVKVHTDKPAQVTVLDAGVPVKQVFCEGDVEIVIPEPKLWNAEYPYLYTLELSCAGEVIQQKFGLREISISSKKELLINGTSVKIRGINHHDSTPEGGWVISSQQLYEDLTQMKKLHINAIRTSHYPPYPYLTELANELGLYVILETDIENHGFIYRNPNSGYKYDMDSPDWPGNIPQWEPEFMERLARAMERFKNQTSVIMWSTGNESGFSNAHKKMLDFMHRRDPSRLAHSQDESYSGSLEYADVFSEMYLSPKKIDELISDPNFNKPVFLCEYAIAIGNGPGDIWDYWEYFWQHPNCIGGCVWQWNDLSVYYNGKLCYGGDFPNELFNDGNNCCTGITSADRTFKPGTMEIAAAYAPMRVHLENNCLKVTNRFDFTSYDSYKLHYYLSIDGKIVYEKDCFLPLAPQETGTIVLDYPLPSECSLGAFVDVALMNDKGEEIASTQIALPVPVVANQPAGEHAVLQDKPLEIAVEGQGFAYRISKQTGNLTALQINGEELLAAPVVLDAFRAPIDNEVNMVSLWTYRIPGKGENLEHTFNNIHKVTVQDGIIHIDGALAGVARRPYLRYKLQMEILQDGSILYTLDGTVAENSPWLPRLGFTFPLRKLDASFNYFAMGPLDCYCDTCHHGRVDYHSSSAQNEFLPQYINPQEHGNHILARELTIEDKLHVTGENFEFQVLPYSARELFKAKHVEDLPQPSATYLRVDYKNSGVGSAFLGPALAEEYRLSEKNIHFKFCLKPIVK